MWFKTRRGPALLTIKETRHQIEVASGETLLEAILAQGLSFPHLCGVGACGTCKSWVVEGKISSLVDLSYLFTAEEINAGCFLPCQARAVGDCEISNPELLPEERKDESQNKL